MAKILNLDSLEDASDKTLVLGGVSHAYVPLTVEQFIEQMKKAEEQDAKGATTVSEFVSYMVDLVQRSFPTVNAEDLQKLPVDRLRLIADFVNDVVQEDNAAAPVADPTTESPAPGN